MTLLEAKTELCSLLDIDYADIANNENISAADLLLAIQTGIIIACDYKPWPFFDEAEDITATADAYYDYPVDFRSNSINTLLVDGVEFAKKRHTDYLKYLQNDANSADKIWSQFKRYIFVNANAVSAGQTISVFGRLKAPIITADVDLMPFSPDVDNEEYSGNMAIVKLAYAEILGSEKKNNPTKASTERSAAGNILNNLWLSFAQDRANEQSLDRPFFNVPDFFGSGGSDIGKF